jgi:hypothetical protein
VFDTTTGEVPAGTDVNVVTGGRVSAGTVTGTVVVVDVELVTAGTVVSASTESGTGFAHTDGDVGDPRLGNNVSRTA